MISSRLVWSLGLSQLILWGISFYFIGVFGDLIIADTGWSRTIVYGGFSAALLAMAAVSMIVGNTVDRIGGRYVMIGGTLVSSASCVALGLTDTIMLYYVAWVGLGIAMRCTLYDAAFATLVRIGGPAARPAITKITLLGGLASTCFWPIGLFLADTCGWRDAALIYGGVALMTVPLHFFIPKIQYQSNETEHMLSTPRPMKDVARNKLNAILYAAIMTLGNGLHAGMSAHLISIFMELGLGAVLAVSAASLRGVGQSTARLFELFFGSRIHPIDLNMIATLITPLCFVFLLSSGGYLAAAVMFSFVYGGTVGLLTITRGTLPLVLFDYETYGSIVGKLLIPSFIASAAAPAAFAIIIENYGSNVAIQIAIAIGFIMLAASLYLRINWKLGSRTQI
jgi:MFS family permease